MSMRDVTPQASTLDEHRRLLIDLHHEIDNCGRDSNEGELYERAYTSLLWFTLRYLTPDFPPDIEIVLRVEEPRSFT